uniref:Uncharacterized protein n=1 Tax=Rhizophora mucronata TaxID=61149 RepID=A0A2P2PKZ8_RHIMU
MELSELVGNKLKIFNPKCKSFYFI